MAALEERKRKLKEDRDSFDINNCECLQRDFVCATIGAILISLILCCSVDVTLDAKQSMGTRKHTRAAAGKAPEEGRKEKRRKVEKNPLTGLVFLLPEGDVTEDLTVLRRVSFGTVVVFWA